jgi:NADH dehydrogenase
MNIVIIGGGFAGINLATELFKSKGVQVTLLIKTTIIFSAAYLSSCYSLLEPSSISYPYVNFLLVKKPSVSSWKVVPSEKKKIILHNGEMSYDHLVFATVLKRVISEWKT